VRRVSAAILAVTLIALGACNAAKAGTGVATAGGGASGAAASPSPSLDRTEQAQLFAQCMREHGVEMADPDAGGGNIKITVSGGPADKTKVDAAMKACQSYLPNGGAVSTPDAQTLEQLRQYAQCMRDHGVDMPDPNPDGGLLIQKSGGTRPDDAAFQAAQEACKDKLPNEKATQ
jgi:hypothetical protein